MSTINMAMAAEVFQPGEFLKEELEARDWTQEEFAEIIGRSVGVVNEVITGRRGITPETAMQIGEALGTGPEFWINLEAQYQLYKVRDLALGNVARKAKLHGNFPIRDMIKRGWLMKSEKLEVLESQVLDFFEIANVDQSPVFLHAAKKSSSYDESGILIGQLAWLMKAKSLASKQVLIKYKKSALENTVSELKRLMIAPEEIRHVQKLLNECGVAFVIVEPMPGSKIDGACFWLEDQPVIALTLRLDRIDNFWFVLRHEIEHILEEHCKSAGLIIDEGVGQASDLDIELIANKAAAEFCVPNNELTNYIARVDPYYFADNRVQAFAARIGVHPGIVVGQLQNKLKQYDKLKKHQVKIRHLITPYSTTDGWGY